MKIVTLASGSKGNCAFIEHGNTSLLVDAGLTFKEIAERADGVVDLSKVRAVLVTHEHIDHIRGVGAVSRNLKAPVYASAFIRAAIAARIGETVFADVDFDAGFTVGDLKIEPFRLPHDAEYTVGFKIDDGKNRLCIATDLGEVTPNAAKMMSGCKTVLLESNHDVDMLKNGRYSMCLKRRILGVQGHLSNDAAAECAATLVESGTERIILGHLSEENNTPEIAFDAVCGTLSKMKIKEGSDAEICVALQRRPSAAFYV